LLSLLLLTGGVFFEIVEQRRQFLAPTGEGGVKTAVDGFERLAQRASALSTTDPQGRAIRRILFGGAADVALDSAGRILIPPFLRTYADVDGEVAIIGAGDYIEIWNSTAWAGELESVTDSDLNARRFSEYDISAG